MKTYDGLGFILGAAGLVCSVFLYSKINKVANTVNMSVSDLSSKTNIDVEKKIIDAAIQKAVDSKVDEVVTYATKLVVRDVYDNMSYQVRMSVASSYSDVKKHVSEEVAKQVSQINMKDLEKTVREKAKDAIVEKFNGNLDDLLEKFNNNLDNVATIYDAVANGIKKQNQETIVKII